MAADRMTDSLATRPGRPVPPVPLRAMRLVAAGLAIVTSVSAGSPATAPPAKQAVVQEQVDELVGRLFAGAAAGPRARATSGAISFEGVAWETGEGVAAGTSDLGLTLDRALTGALTQRRLSVAPGSLSGSKGIGSTILRGGFQVLKSGVQLSLLLVDASSGQIISKAQRILDPANFTGVAAGDMLPPDAQNAKLLARLITGSLGGAPTAGGLRVSTDRGAQAAYAEGETLHVLIQSERDCYVRLYHVSWSDRTLTLVFPNRSDLDSYLPAGTVKAIPAEGTGVVFQVSKPYGVDALIAISSAEPFEDDAMVAAGLGGTALPSFAGTARGVTRVGDYLARQGISEAQAKGVLAKGLLVRLPDGQAPPVSAPTPEPVSYEPAPAAPAGITPPSQPEGPPEQTYPPSNVRTPPQTVSPPASPGASGRSPLARAVCYYTTLPRLRLIR
jgi:hypothetical protein